VLALWQARAMKMKAAGLLLVAFIGGSLMTGLFVGRAAAQVTMQRPKFEYMCQSGITKPWKDDIQKLNGLGAQGWELVQQLVGLQGTNGDVYCFKRQIP
jgi:hypothetical protein